MSLGPGNVPEGVPGKVPGNVPGKVLGNDPGKVPGDDPGDVLKKTVLFENLKNVMELSCARVNVSQYRKQWLKGYDDSYHPDRCDRVIDSFHY